MQTTSSLQKHTNHHDHRARLQNLYTQY